MSSQSRSPRIGGYSQALPALKKGLGPRLRGENGRQKTRPPSAVRATSPRGGRSSALKSSHSGGSTRAAGVGGLVWVPHPKQKASPRLEPWGGFLYRALDGAQERTRTSTTFRSLAPEASASTNSATWALFPADRIKAGALDRASQSPGQCSFWRQMTLIGGQGRLGRCAGRAARLSRGQQGRFAGS